jgi:hypothetical protein
MSLQLTTQDIQRLRQQQLDRLRKVFVKPLGLCRLQLTRQHRLVIHCPEAWIVDALMNDLDRLSEAARIIVGAQSLSVCFIGEEVYRARSLQPMAQSYAS